MRMAGWLAGWLAVSELPDSRAELVSGIVSCPVPLPSSSILFLHRRKPDTKIQSCLMSLWGSLVVVIRVIKPSCNYKLSSNSISHFRCSESNFRFSNVYKNHCVSLQVFANGKQSVSQKVCIQPNQIQKTNSKWREGNRHTENRQNHM